MGDRERVQAGGPPGGQIQPAALAEPGAAAAGRPAGGRVGSDRSARDRQARLAVVVGAAAEAVAAVSAGTPGATDGLVAGEQAAAEAQDRSPEVDQRAPQPGAPVLAGTSP